ncbi:hypothetical protein OSTOST_19034 [Ostertagia ostertagi]
MIASGVAVELLSSVLQYPDPLRAPANIGEPGRFVVVVGCNATSSSWISITIQPDDPMCTAIRESVSLVVMNCPSYLEKLTGLDQLQASINDVHIEFSDDNDSVMSL